MIEDSNGLTLATVIPFLVESFNDHVYRHVEETRTCMSTSIEGSWFHFNIDSFYLKGLV